MKPLIHKAYQNTLLTLKPYVDWLKAIQV